MTEETSDDSPSTPLEIQRHLLLMMIIWNLDSPGRSGAQAWAPPMTADGEQMKRALELEKLVRQVWSRFVPSKPPRFRAPLPSEDPTEHRRLENARADVLLESRTRYRSALEQILYSDEVFQVFPKDAEADLRRIRALLEGVTHEGVPPSPAA